MAEWWVDFRADLKFLFYFVVTLAVFLVFTRLTIAVTGMPGAVSFIAVGIIALIVRHNISLLRPTKNKHIAHYHVSEEETRQVAVINGVKVQVVRCISTRFEVCANPSGATRVEIDMKTVGLADEAEFYSLHLTPTDHGLMLLTNMCRRITGPDQTLEAFDCFVDHHGNAIGVGHRSANTAYLA